MDYETIKVAAAVGGVLVAIISLAFGIFQYRANTKIRRSTPYEDRKEEIRTTIQALVGRLDSSLIFKVIPHYENWEKGFPSLSAFRDTVQAANTIVSHTSLAPDDIKDITSGLFSKTMSVMLFRDSFDRFTVVEQRKKGNKFGVWDYSDWPQGREAENALKDLQDFKTSREARLKEYLRELNKT